MYSRFHPDIKQYMAKQQEMGENSTENDMFKAKYPSWS